MFQNSVSLDFFSTWIPSYFRPFSLSTFLCIRWVTNDHPSPALLSLGDSFLSLSPDHFETKLSVLGDYILSTVVDKWSPPAARKKLLSWNGGLLGWDLGDSQISSKKAFWCRLRLLILLYPMSSNSLSTWWFRSLPDSSRAFSGRGSSVSSPREPIRANVSYFSLHSERRTLDWIKDLFLHMKKFSLSFFGRSIIAFGHSRGKPLQLWATEKREGKNFVYSRW